MTDIRWENVDVPEYLVLQFGALWSGRQTPNNSSSFLAFGIWLRI